MEIRQHVTPRMKKMEDLNDSAFRSLFAEVCLKAFGHALETPLPEADAKILSSLILEKTGLVVGAKTLRNYSRYVHGRQARRRENPSVATLDTLSRFILDAPYSDEANRKNKEGHFPYWFRYRGGLPPTRQQIRSRQRSGKAGWILGACLLVIIFIVMLISRNPASKAVIENFNTEDSDSLQFHGWKLYDADNAWWNKRDAIPGFLTLYTLTGDNWQDDTHPSGIRNLLIHQIAVKDFSAELHLSEFQPSVNWQQAGLLLSEDSTFSGKVVRLSISYNDFFGGYKKSPEIFLQAVSSAQSGRQSRPEEIAHVPIFTLDQDDSALIHRNLRFTTLKIEKKGATFRFLFSSGPIEAFAFKEVVSGDFDFQPHYVGIFAIQGFSQTENPMPVRIQSFKLLPL